MLSTLRQRRRCLLLEPVQVEDPRPVSAWAALHAAVFCLTLLLACAAIRELGPSPCPEVTARLEQTTGPRSPCSIVFLGNSWIARGIDTEVFDRVLTERGHATRSAALAVSGAQGPECRYLLERLLADRPPGLRWVIYEPDGLVQQGRRGRRDWRWIHWHDLPSTGWAIRLDHERQTLLPTTAMDLRTSAGHLEAFAWRALAMSYAQDWARGQLSRRDEAAARARLWRARLRTRAVHARDWPAVLARWSAVQDRRMVDPTPPTAAQREFLAELAGICEAADCRLALLLGPSLKHDRSMVPAALPRATPLFRYDDARRYPALYDYAHRLDRGHLNQAGARVFSELLAHDVADYLDGQRTADPAQPR